MAKGDFTPEFHKPAEQILREAAARAKAEGAIVLAHKLRRMAEQVEEQRHRSVQ